MTRAICLALALGALAVISQPAVAATITYNFAGEHAAPALLGGILLPSELADWTTFSGTLQIDSSIADSQAGLDAGLYSAAALSIDVSYDTGFSVSGSSGEVVQIRSTSLSNSSWYAQQFSPTSTDLVSGLQLISINVALIDSDSPGQDLFIDPNTLLSDLPALGGLNLKRLEMIFTDGIGGTAYIRGTLLELTAVPEPSTLALAGGAALGLLFAARRRPMWRADFTI